MWFRYFQFSFKAMFHLNKTKTLLNTQGWNDVSRTKYSLELANGRYWFQEIVSCVHLLGIYIFRHVKKILFGRYYRNKVTFTTNEKLSFFLFVLFELAFSRFFFFIFVVCQTGLVQNSSSLFLLWKLCTKCSIVKKKMLFPLVFFRLLGFCR
jgi:hypothetical protein